MQQPSCTSCSDVFDADGKSATEAGTEGLEAPDWPLRAQPLDQPQALQQAPAARVPPPEAATGGSQQHQAALTVDKPCQAVTSIVGRQQQAAPSGSMAAGTSNVQQPAATQGYVRQQAASWNRVYANAAWQSIQVQTAGCLALHKLQALCLEHSVHTHNYRLILPHHGCTWMQDQELGQSALASPTEATAVPAQHLDRELRSWGSLHSNAVWQPSVEQTPGLAGAAGEVPGGTDDADEGDSQSDEPSILAPAGRAGLHGRSTSRQACSSQAHCSAAASDKLLPCGPAGPSARAALHHLPVAVSTSLHFLQQAPCRFGSDSVHCAVLPSQCPAAGYPATARTVRLPS